MRTIGEIQMMTGAILTQLQKKLSLKKKT